MTPSDPNSLYRRLFDLFGGKGGSGSKDMHTDGGPATGRDMHTDSKPPTADDMHTDTTPADPT